MTRALAFLLSTGLSLTAVQTAHSSELHIEKGTTSLGGTAGISVMAVSGQTQFVFGANPSLGFFLTDEIQLFGSLMLSSSNDSLGWGLGIGVNYVTEFTSLEGVKSYAGVRAEIYGNDARWVGAQAGVLFPLSEHVAMDLGVRPQYEFRSGLFMLNVGWLGVNAYFQ